MRSQPGNADRVSEPERIRRLAEIIERSVSAVPSPRMPTRCSPAWSGRASFGARPVVSQSASQSVCGLSTEPRLPGSTTTGPEPFPTLFLLISHVFASATNPRNSMLGSQTRPSISCPSVTTAHVRGPPHKTPPTFCHPLRRGQGPFQSISVTKSGSSPTIRWCPARVSSSRISLTASATRSGERSGRI